MAMAMADAHLRSSTSCVPSHCPALVPALATLTSLRKCAFHKPSFPSLVFQSYCLGWASGRGKTAASAVPVTTSGSSIDIKKCNEQARDARLQHLEAQALETLQKTVENFEKPAFPCALIAGDVVILDLLHRIGAFSDNKVKIIFIDTFHLFPETYKFLSEVEERYGFKAHVFHAADVNNKEAYDAKFGSDLFITDIEEYDRICKVEPFSRALKTLEVDAMINGRRRDHGAERAHLEVFEEGKMVKVQPLAYWEFRDCWDYLTKYSLPYHPLHDQGFPSIGDVQSTIPVPREKWFEYAGERSGRFQGLTNPDGSAKTECGIHVGGRT
nr:phosphoadenosine-phosphosulphate reductase [Physcomitrium patens]